jgi:L-ascorbate metabolism protein UlaG (beta-lactamase superfamily)
LKYTQNHQLKTIKENWPGTPIDHHDRFVNIEFPFVPKTKDVLKWLITENPQKLEKKEDAFRLPIIRDTSFLTQAHDCIVWLGHATFFIRLNGVSLLLDPVFYNVPFVKRYASHALRPNLFTNLDYLLISHDHLDHCQKRSIREIVIHNRHISILTGLNMETLLRPWSRDAPIQMAGWYQQYKTSPDIDIYFLPSRHWSKRGLLDENERLWGAYIIKSKEKTIYFGGDSGYGSHFKEVKTIVPHVDVAILGVGAYKPEWFMHPNHASPADAVKAFNDMEAQVLIPMHFGTFDISDEPVGDPFRKLQSLEREGNINGALKLLSIGETLVMFKKL